MRLFAVDNSEGGKSGPAALYKKRKGFSSLAVLVSAQVLAGLIKRDRPPARFGHGRDAFSASARFAIVDCFKILLVVIIVLVRRRQGKRDEDDESPSVLWDAANAMDSEELLPLEAVNEQGGEFENPGEGNKDILSSLSRSSRRQRPQWVALGILATLLTASAYFPYLLEKIVEPIYIYMASIYTPLITATLSLLFFSHSFTSLQWSAMLLQSIGIYLAQGNYLLSSYDISTYILLLAFASLLSSAFLFTEHVFSRQKAFPYYSAITLFTITFSFNFLVTVISWISGNLTLTSVLSEFSTYASSELLLHAVIDVATLFVISDHGAVSFAFTSVEVSLSSLIYSRFLLRRISILDVVAIFAVFAALYWMLKDPEDEYVPLITTSKPLESSLIRKVVQAVIVAPILIWAAYILIFNGTSQRIFASSSPSIFLDLAYLPPTHVETCKSKELPSIHYYNGTRTYHEFDDVLLIVFFSHARYDVNLDFYRSVYAEFFPNMVFVGPASREDAGFAGSYDVVLDSYESYEDLSDPLNYKMAGRMAHHMLYTILADPTYSCYKGYLWAPFDTLLNIPRLQQFDKDRFWYHSPWGEYVPNYAIGIRDNSTSEIVEGTDYTNKSMHPEPLRISPDPALNLTETFRGWWMDWWWGDPNVGIGVCMPAFLKVPQPMRDRITKFTNGTTRFLGGSADTLYIPDRLMDDFRTVLGLFLETDCFLEIAVPTAVHLVLPEEENTLWVDHWWIWEPPLNASFVRDKWKEGKDVDTFHTFHWGDKGDDGIWRAIPENVPDVRRLLDESAERQGVKIS